ncbi:TlpA family protein disulfide reductase [Litoribacter populi]|uniref:TlpA family protein disulfide reductase n=1 Tax=Litoribacter populi TaxID=2598460 RepID=UPI00117E2219|nr:TlpA disulfide reductase family protein [Litoribacter populi]
MKKRMIFFFLGLVCLMGRVEIVVGQEVAAHPDSSAEKVGGAPVVVHGVIRSDHEPDNPVLSFFKTYTYKSRYAPGVQTVELPVMEGSILEGRGRRERIFEYVLPDMDSLGYLSVGLGNDLPIIDRFIVLPGDTLILYLDLRFGGVYFEGNAVERMELQQQLAWMDRTEKAFRQATLVIDDHSKITEDPMYVERYRDLVTRNAPRMLFLRPGEEETAYLMQDLPHADDPALLKKLDFISQSGLDANLKRLLSDNVRSNYYADFIHRFNGAYKLAELRKDTAQTNRLQDIMESDLKGKMEAMLGEEWHPEAFGPVDLFGKWSIFLRRAEGISQFEALRRIHPPWFREKAMVAYFSTRYEYVVEAGDQLEAYLGEVQDPYLRRYLFNLLSLKQEGGSLQHFDFVDEHGEKFDLDRLKGKVTLLDFYITGCRACLGFFEKTIKPLQEAYGDRDDFQILAISADKSEAMWRESVALERYSTPDMINLHSEGKAKGHPFFVHYNISGFPRKMILDREGRIYQFSGIPYSYPEISKVIESALNKNGTPSAGQ